MQKILKIKSFILKHPEFFTILGLGILFYFIFFHGIGTYALMDVDESRYVSMSKDMFLSKDFLTLYLNNEFFFEKPPLYFWGECISFALFGKINEFTARFPVALYGTLCCYLAYFMGRKIISRGYGVIASLILATSLEFVILAKFAILDIVVAACIWASICFGMSVYFCRESHKKYFWWMFYIFSGLAVMAKGIPGFVVPFGAMFFISIASGKFKEIFKPQYFLIGIGLFLLVTLPWHLIMFKLHNPLFWDEYIIKHHIARFLGEGGINRTQPFYFYFLTLLWGFFPWSVSCLSVWIKDLIRIIKERNWKFDRKELSTAQRFIFYNVIIAVFTLLFFTSSKTKLITYILPMYGSLACVGAYVWYNYIKRISNEKIINITVYITGGVFLFATIASILTPLYLPEQLYTDISTVKTFCVVSSFAFGLASIMFAKRKLYKAVFASYVLLILAFSAYATEKFFEIDYAFGQNDLLRFAQYAKKHNITLTTYGFAQKYSLIFYSGQPVLYKKHMKPSELEGALDKDKNMVIIPYKKMEELKGVSFDIIKNGRRYALVDEDT